MPVLPPGCSFEKPDTIQEFILKGKAALVSVGIVRDTILGKLFCIIVTLQLSKIKMLIYSC